MVWNDPAGLVAFESPAGKAKFTAFRHDVIRDVPFLLPASVHKDPVDVALPFAYVQFLAIYVYLFLTQAAEDGHEKWPPLPAIELELTYMDIGENVHRRRFRVRASFFYLGLPMGEDTRPQKCGAGEFEIERL